MKDIKIGDTVYVEWVDTFSYNGWFSAEELVEKAKEGENLLKSAGIYAGQRGSFIILCSNYCPVKVLSTSPYGHPNFIPKGAVKNIKKVKI